MKRKTKSQKEAEAKAALRRRIHDFYAGACGNEDVEDESFFLTLEPASRLLPALRRHFESDGRGYMWEPHCLENFENVDRATDFLFKHGVRA